MIFECVFLFCFHSSCKYAYIILLGDIQIFDFKLLNICFLHIKYNSKKTKFCVIGFEYIFGLILNRKFYLHRDEGASNVLIPSIHRYPNEGKTKQCHYVVSLNFTSRSKYAYRIFFFSANING